MVSHKLLDTDESHKKYIFLEPYRLTGQELRDKMKTLEVPEPVWKYAVDPNCSYFFGIIDEFAPYDYQVFIGNKYRDSGSGTKLQHCKSYMGHLGILSSDRTLCPGESLVHDALYKGVDHDDIQLVTARFLWKALGTEILEKRVYPKFEQEPTEKKSEKKKSKEKAKGAQFAHIAAVITEPMTREQIAKKLGEPDKKVFRALRKMSKAGELKKKRTEEGAVLFYIAGTGKEKKDGNNEPSTQAEAGSSPVENPTSQE